MFNIYGFMSELAAKRPVFHSEADFQHAFAWQFHELFPNSVVRLEYPVYTDKWIHLDLWLDVPTMRVAVELKYKTLRIEIPHNDEHFHLKSHSAQPLGRYDFLKDVARLEQVKGMKPGVEGYAVLLTNDPFYWRTGRAGSIDINFRLHHGRIVTGELGWLPNTSADTIRGRTQALRLSRSYTVEWKPFSKLAANTGGEFRYLVFKI